MSQRKIRRKEKEDVEQEMVKGKGQGRERENAKERKIEAFLAGIFLFPTIHHLPVIGPSSF